MDWILQKGTELGLYAFVPLVTQRSLPARAGAGKLARWQHIERRRRDDRGERALPAVAAPRPLYELPACPASGMFWRCLAG